MKFIPFLDFVSIHQTKSVANNAINDSVWSFTIPKKTVAFIQKIGTVIFQNTSMRWLIDEEIVDGNIQRQIGTLANPQVFDPPYVAYNKIEFQATNNSGSSQTFEVLVDGYLIMQSEFK